MSKEYYEKLLEKTPEDHPSYKVYQDELARIERMSQDPENKKKVTVVEDSDGDDTDS